MKLTLKNINKSFGSKEVLKDISFTFTPGVYGLLGANGTGKTTLMKLICGLITADKGTILLDGEKTPQDYAQVLGLLPQDFNYYPNFSGKDFLLYMATLKGMNRTQAKEEAERLLRIIHLDDVQNKKIVAYSGGMKRRLGIAQALLNNPQILILDEPTVGLDPKERIKFRTIISQLSTDRIIVLSTHIVSDVEAIAKEILILKNGQFIKHGSREQLLQDITGQIWEIYSNTGGVHMVHHSDDIINEKVDGKLRTLRVISPTPPTPESKMVLDPNLEDLYLYYFLEEESQ